MAEVKTVAAVAEPDAFNFMSAKTPRSTSIHSFGPTNPPAPQPSHSYIGRVDPNEYERRVIASSGVEASRLLGPVGSKSDFKVVPHFLLMRRVYDVNATRLDQTPSYPGVNVFSTVNGLLDDEDVVFAGVPYISRDPSPLSDDTMTCLNTGEEYIPNSGPFPIAEGQYLYFDKRPYSRINDMGVVESCMWLTPETKSRLLPSVLPLDCVDVDTACAVMEKSVKKLIFDKNDKDEAAMAFWKSLSKWEEDEKGGLPIQENAGIKSLLELIRKVVVDMRFVSSSRTMDMYGLWFAAHYMLNFSTMINRGSLASARRHVMAAIASFIEYAESVCKKKLEAIAASKSPFVADDDAEVELRTIIGAFKRRGDLDAIATIAIIDYIKLRLDGAKDDHRKDLKTNVFGRALDGAEPGRWFKFMMGYIPGY
jgi:hypothetical protein